MQRFYHQNLPKGPAEATLSTEESHHLLHVLRIEAGDTITLIDGLGNLATAEVIKPHAKGTLVKIVSVTMEKQSSQVHLAFAIPKGPALEFIVKRCTEVGVSSFQPLVTAHSLAKNGWNETRWLRVVAEVGKQCQSAWFPKLCPALTLQDWLVHRDKNRTLFFCDELDRKLTLETKSDPKACDIVVGAEGGWNREEVEQLRLAGGKAVGLGSNRLRAETATLVATTLIKAMLGEL